MRTHAHTKHKQTETHARSREAKLASLNDAIKAQLELAEATAWKERSDPPRMFLRKEEAGLSVHRGEAITSSRATLS